MNGNPRPEISCYLPAYVARSIGGVSAQRFDQSGQAGQAVGLFDEGSDSLSRCAILRPWASAAKWL